MMASGVAIEPALPAAFSGIWAFRNGPSIEVRVLAFYAPSRLSSSRMAAHQASYFHGRRQDL